MITYLLGAGASAFAVPVAEKLIGSIQFERNELADKFTPKTEQVDIDGIEYSLYELKKELINDFDWLINEGGKHQSIDTFAKKLSIQGEEFQVKKLKALLSITFVLSQSRNRADIRYDSFFASILGNSPTSFPPNLRILSWNYDYQLEKAFAEYYRDYRIESCQTMLNVYSKNIKAPSFDLNKFGVIKLNGTAALIMDKNKAYPHVMVDKTNQEYSNELIEGLLTKYALLLSIKGTSDSITSSLSFAWEDFPDLIDKVYSSIAGTEILVVIGYSFPFFNRNIDRMIIGKLSHLKKVYFQAPDAEDLRERFLAIRSDLNINNLHIRKDTHQFAFPNEL